MCLKSGVPKKPRRGWCNETRNAYYDTPTTNPTINTGTVMFTPFINSGTADTASNTYW